MENVLEVRNLSVSFDSPKGEVQAVRDVSFSLHKGEVLAVVGESGCGKSVLCKSIMKLLPKTARIKEGSIRVMGTDITGYKEKEMQKIRGKIFSMIFQDPMTSLNPTMKIGQQIAEAILIHDKRKTKEQVYKKVLELMELVGIEHAQERYHSYPYNFSGGMRQRSVMAIALASDPDILFADEPTTALDVTIQAQILDLLGEIQKKMGTSTILVSHDLGVVARTADRVAVMQSLPYFSRGKENLYTIPGMPPSLVNPPKGDAYACRNEYALGIDYEEMPPMFQITDTHYAATWLLDKRAPQIIPPVGGKKVE